LKIEHLEETTTEELNFVLSTIARVNFAGERRIVAEVKVLIEVDVVVDALPQIVPADG
jgi:hypothetical protein